MNQTSKNSVGYFLLHFLYTLFRPPTDLILLNDDRFPSDLLHDLLPYSGLHKIPRQWWTYKAVEQAQFDSRVIEFRHSSERTQVLLISTIISTHFYELRHVLQTITGSVLDAYGHAHIVILPEPKTSEGLDEHLSIASSVFPPDTPLLAIAYDPTAAGLVTRVSGDLRRWHRPAEFLQYQRTMAARGAFDPWHSTLVERLHVMRNRIPPIGSFVFWSMDTVRSSAFRRERPYIELLQQYFDCTITLKDNRMPPIGKRSENISIAATVSTMMPTASHASIHDELLVPRFGRRQFYVLAPNWWHKQQRGTFRRRHVAVQRQQQAIVVLALGALLLGAFVVARWTQSGRQFGQIALDTWARMLGCAGESMSTGVGEHPGRVLELWRERIGLLVSVWGMWNGATMMSLLVDALLGDVWTPVFQRVADVWQHSADLPIVYADIAAAMLCSSLWMKS